MSYFEQPGTGSKQPTFKQLSPFEIQQLISGKQQKRQFNFQAPTPSSSSLKQQFLNGNQQQQQQQQRQPQIELIDEPLVLNDENINDYDILIFIPSEKTSQELQRKGVQLAERTISK